jgi:hypothetical protein
VTKPGNSYAIADVMKEAARLAGGTPAKLEQLTGATTLNGLAAVLREGGTNPTRVLAEAALLAFRAEAGNDARRQRDKLAFLVADRRPPADLAYANDDGADWSLDPQLVKQAVQAANRTIELIHDLAAANDAPIFALLGLRNLSSFVGEIFAGEIRKLHADRFMKNPNQDGYPDLLALTARGRRYIEQLKASNQSTDKKHWSPYPFGGVEVKATCGNTPPAAQLAKPEIGEARLPILQSAEWKAHHRETNKLIGIFWDFVDGLPTVVAAFYRNDLTEDDWGGIVHPREGGGRTTSVSIMNRAGVKKMGAGWVVLPKDPALLRPLAQQRVFAITEPMLVRASSDEIARALMSRNG